MRSLPLGVARLTQQFLTKDPPSAGQVRALEAHLDHELDDLLDEVRRAGAVQAIGTSGTVNTLVAMALAARGDDAPRLHGASASADQVARLRQRVLAHDAEERAELPGMDAKRVDLMPAVGSPARHHPVARRRARSGGLLLGAARRRPARPARRIERAGTRDAGRAAPQRARARERAMRATNAHGRHVAMLALQLHDALAADLGLPPAARELLEFAALLHDIGHAIEHDRHHRHTCYLIRHSELLGFSPVEIEVIALAARGHRKQAPRISDPERAGPAAREPADGARHGAPCCASPMRSTAPTSVW